VAELGPLKLGGQDGFAAVASCGTVQSATDKHAESALLIAIKGSTDYYTIQWTERGPPSRQAAAAGSRPVGKAVQHVEPDQDLPDRAERGRAISKLPWAEIAYPGVEDRPITMHQQGPASDTAAAFANARLGKHGSAPPTLKWGRSIAPTTVGLRERARFKSSRAPRSSRTDRISGPGRPSAHPSWCLR